MAARQYTQREWRLLSWWLATFHPFADVAMNVRVGPSVAPGAFPIDDPALLRMARVRNRWVDAVMIENGRPTIIEAKLEPDPGVYSRLFHYARKFRSDPQFRQFSNVPLSLHALIYHEDPSVAVEAPFYGVRWENYQPQLAEMPPVMQRGSPLSIGDSFLQLPADFPQRLKALGIEGF
jgi:hypothetical protein